MWNTYRPREYLWAGFFLINPIDLRPLGVEGDNCSIEYKSPSSPFLVRPETRDPSFVTIALEEMCFQPASTTPPSRPTIPLPCATGPVYDRVLVLLQLHLVASWRRRQRCVFPQYHQTSTSCPQLGDAISVPMARL